MGERVDVTVGRVGPLLPGRMDGIWKCTMDANHHKGRAIA
jgi:hypothetical protein